MRDDVQYFRDVYNIDRIEAFKGPNAMIFGRGSPGGLLNRVTKFADWNTLREIGLQVGSWDKKRLTADINQSVNDKAAFRVTGVYEDSEGFRDGFELERKGINPTLSLRPGEDTLVTLGYEYFHDERTADRGIPSYPTAYNGTRHPFDTDRETFFGDAAGSPTWIEVNAFNALVEHDFGGGTVLRNRTRYADYNKLYQNVFPGSINPAPNYGPAIGVQQQHRSPEPVQPDRPDVLGRDRRDQTHVPLRCRVRPSGNRQPAQHWQVCVATAVPGRQHHHDLRGVPRQPVGLGAGDVHQ